MIDQDLNITIDEYFTENFDKVRDGILENVRLEQVEDDEGHERLEIVNYYSVIRNTAEILAEEMCEIIPKVEGLSDKKFDSFVQFIKYKIAKLFPCDEIEQIARNNYQEWLEDVAERRSAFQGNY